MATHRDRLIRFRGWLERRIRCYRELADKAPKNQNAEGIDTYGRHKAQAMNAIALLEKFEREDWRAANQEAET